MKKLPLPCYLYTYFILLTCCCFNVSCDKNDDKLTRRQTSPITVISNIQYGSNTDWKGNTVGLLLDIYQPQLSSSGQKFPLIIYAHGGGFHDGSKEDNKTLMNDFAASGYVAASINYRLGWTQSDSCDGDTTESKEALYRAVQDARAAIRFLTANASKYNIDTNYIFLDGESAGAITVLNVQYLSQQAANVLIPGAETTLGALATADNNLTNSYTISGIGSVAGCLYFPELINQQNAVPSIFFHGEMDSVIPYAAGPFYSCPNFITVYGSMILYNRLKNFVPSVLHSDPSGTHTVYDEEFIKNNEVCFFNSILHKNTETGSFTGTASSCE